MSLLARLLSGGGLLESVIPRTRRHLSTCLCSEACIGVSRNILRMFLGMGLVMTPTIIWTLGSERNSMGGELEKFDTGSMADRIQEKIKLEVVGLIPDEQWKAMIENTLKRFMEPTKSTSGYERDTKPAELDTLIKDCITGIFKEKITEMLHDAEFMKVTFQTHGRPLIEGKIKEMAQEVAPAVLTGMVSQICYDVVQQIQSNASSGRY